MGREAGIRLGGRVWESVCGRERVWERVCGRESVGECVGGRVCVGVRGRECGR